MSKTYYILIKTADAEKRTVLNSNFLSLDQIIPILEITRGRKIPKKKNQEINQSFDPMAAGVYSFEKNYQSFLSNFEKNKEFFVDITREPLLSCYEAEAICNSSNGYRSWVDFYIQLKREYTNCHPVIISNPSENETEDEYKSNIRGQFTELSKISKKITYRASIFTDETFIYDLIILNDLIKSYEENGGVFYLLLDHEYIRPYIGRNHEKRTSSIIDSVLPYCQEENIIFLATSYPKSATDIGGEDYGLFPIEEVFLFNLINKNHKKIQYGDYAGINPIRNDEVIMASGWRPRIDYPAIDDGEFKYFYHREKRNIINTVQISATAWKNIFDSYEVHYISVAQKVINDNLYKELTQSWGNLKILETSMGQVAGAAPSYWISVRMDCHIHHILKNLINSNKST